MASENSKPKEACTRPAYTRNLETRESERAGRVGQKIA